MMLCLLIPGDNESFTRVERGSTDNTTGICLRRMRLILMSNAGIRGEAVERFDTIVRMLQRTPVAVDRGCHYDAGGVCLKELRDGAKYGPGSGE
jgi:hypothetical protein